MCRLHVCVDLSLYPSGILMKIRLLAGCTLFTGIPSMTKFLVAPESNMVYCFVICIIDVKYAVSVCLFFIC